LDRGYERHVINVSKHEHDNIVSHHCGNDNETRTWYSRQSSLWQWQCHYVLLSKIMHISSTCWSSDVWTKIDWFPRLVAEVGQDDLKFLDSETIPAVCKCLGKPNHWTTLHLLWSSAIPPTHPPTHPPR